MTLTQRTIFKLSRYSHFFVLKYNYRKYLSLCICRNQHYIIEWKLSKLWPWEKASESQARVSEVEIIILSSNCDWKLSKYTFQFVYHLLIHHPNTYSLDCSANTTIHFFVLFALTTCDIFQIHPSSLLCHSRQVKYKEMKGKSSSRGYYSLIAIETKSKSKTV